MSKPIDKSDKEIEIPEWLPDNPCSEDAHQMVFDSTDGNIEQTQIITYMSGYFEGEGCVRVGVKGNNNSINYTMEPKLHIESATSQMSGLFDAEGSIGFFPYGSTNYKNGYGCNPRVRITQNKDGTIVEQIFETYCSLFEIDYTSHEEERQGRSPSVTCAVGKSNHIRKFLTPMLPLLMEKQRQAIIMLREILPRFEDGVHHTKEGFIEMMKWKHELDKGKPMGDDDRKYTVEYFEDLWRDEIESQQRLDDNWGSESDASE
jgi:hypothetical protein